MSNTAQPATAQPADAPAFTVTADIEVTSLGSAYLRVDIDGEPVTFEINPHTLKLRQISVTDEAERLLKRHAGYRAADAWTTDERGHLTASLGEITGRCTICVHGCGCEIGGTGCGHYMCPAASAQDANTCDGAALALAAYRTYPAADGKRYPRRGAARRCTRR